MRKVFFLSVVIVPGLLSSGQVTGGDPARQSGGYRARGNSRCKRFRYRARRERSTGRKPITAGNSGLTFHPGNTLSGVTNPGFASYENNAVTIAAGRTVSLDITLGITLEETQVTVGDELSVNTDPEATAGATVLKGKDLEALPDNAEDLEAALQALAGPAAGPNGGEIFIDGFSGGRLPPRDTIREIRINQNPFSSEYDRLGFGRIEILTKPGTDRFARRGGVRIRRRIPQFAQPFRAEPRAVPDTQFQRQPRRAAYSKKGLVLFGSGARGSR